MTPNSSQASWFQDTVAGTWPRTLHTIATKQNTMPETTKPKLVLAYSGGLDTSVILKWLCEKGFEVIAFCANVGQFEEDFSAVEAKALAVGATKCVITDLRKEFVSDYVFEAIKCNALYEGRYLLGTSIARPCIAKEMIRIATEEGATYIGESWSSTSIPFSRTPDRYLSVLS